MRQYVYLFISDRVWTNIIRAENIEQEDGRHLQLVPYAEAWYPGDIPLSLVNDVLEVTVIDNSLLDSPLAMTSMKRSKAQRERKISPDRKV